MAENVEHERTGYGRILQGRVAVLVGVGAPGETVSNGRATAVEFARCGATLVLADRDAAALGACAEAVQPFGGEVLQVQLDATDEAAVQGLFASCRDRFGTVDVLHNNLGITSAGRIARATVESFDLCVAVNLKSVFLLCKHVLPIMEEMGRGAITNISSVSSIRHLGISSPLYDMTKAGLNALTRNIAIDYGPKGIRANAILVGMMDTPLARGGIEKAGRDVEAIYEGYVQRIPSRRMGSGHDTAHLAAFLASDLASYINGAEIVVDGALTAKSG
ncbi:hypothetical protein FHS85_004824 [Rhodoligotrophos appendicifer]|uniref:SDR family NAD(P)-dependent oxidoreductase n=1 Tax=Rhodoligotrophos appendicifer TaxID=987056 RepID=UPI0011858F25|nr:SDR family oxidoreductase [Rhodoligotrophos appendicifer]